MRGRTFGRTVATLALLPALGLAAEPGDETLQAIKKACDRGCNWLIDHQNTDGGYGPKQGGRSTVGITALVVTALARSPRAYREVDGPFVSDAVAFLLANRHEDGGIYDFGLQNYSTSMAILALKTVNEGKYAEVLAAARDFVKGLQANEESEPRPYRPDEHITYGGTGYGSSRRTDLSNTGWAAEAMHEMGLPKGEAYWKRVVRFTSRCQNLCEGNDAITGGLLRDVASTEDGGLTYYPGYSPAGAIRTRDGKLAYSSYGSMTYMGIKNFIYAGLGRDDPRVRGAYDWIRAYYTVDVNPGMGSADPRHAKDGLFYNYVVMAKALALIGDAYIVTADGKRHLWAKELADKIVSLQRTDGSWANENPRWWESILEIATPYAILALSTCSDVLKGLPEGKGGPSAAGKAAAPAAEETGARARPSEARGQTQGRAATHEAPAARGGGVR